MKHASKPTGPSFGAKLALFALVAAAWIAFDRFTKAWADTAAPGDVLIEDIAGLFEFRLVHNTGAAWGIFSDSTFALGVFSVIVCVFLLVVLFTHIRKNAGLVQTFGLALVFAGGAGNAVDRLSYSYVIDFINAKFIDFPVFNVADIGVTCGIAIFLVAMLLHDWRSRPEKAE